MTGMYKMTFPFRFLSLIIVIFFFISCTSEKNKNTSVRNSEDNSTKVTTRNDGSQKSVIDKKYSSKADPIPYKIAKTNDLSSPIIIPNTKPIETVRKKKIQYFIVLGESVNKEQVKVTVDKVIKEIRNKDPEVDEIILYLCTTKGVASHGTYDIGTAIWAPNGELGNMTAKIAQNNLRDNYSLSLEIKDNLEEYLEKRRNNTETKKFGLTVKKRKEIYQDLVKAGDKAIKMADKKYSISSTKNMKTTVRLRKKFKRQVMEKYGITKEVAKKISWEGFKKKWPQPEFK